MLRFKGQSTRNTLAHDVCLQMAISPFSNITKPTCTCISTTCKTKSMLRVHAKINWNTWMLKYIPALMNALKCVSLADSHTWTVEHQTCKTKQLDTSKHPYWNWQSDVCDEWWSKNHLLTRRTKLYETHGHDRREWQNKKNMIDTFFKQDGDCKLRSAQNQPKIRTCKLHVQQEGKD